jgi:hypothetical protein
MIDSHKNLCFNSDRTQFFLIPQDRELPSGNFILHRGINHQISVDPIAIEPFEVTRDRAKAWLDSQWDEVIDETKKSASELFQHWSSAPLETPTPLDPETREKLADGIEELSKALAQRLRRPD